MYRPLNRWQLMFCRLVLQLDRIPRYGRNYTYIPAGKRVDDPDVLFGPGRWEWQRRGRWGMNLLDRLGLFFRYIDATNPELAQDIEGEDD